jgi:Phage tail tube protein, TTP
MSYTLPDGGIFAIASAYGSALTVSAITNANPAVATSTAHGFANGDYVEITSGWANLNNRVVRVAGVAANTFQLEGINTTSTTRYPAAGGTGTVRKVNTFTQISQVLSTGTDGGEQQFATYRPLESDREFRIPTGVSAQGLTLGLVDDPTLAGYIACVAAKEDRLQRALLFTLAGGSKIVYNGFVGINETPTTNAGEVMQVTASFSLNAAPVRYAT